MTQGPDKTDAVVLCGGLGTRLRAAVPGVAKSMAEVDGTPFLKLLLDYVAGFGFRRFILCVGYRAGDVEGFFKKAEAGYKVVFSREEGQLGTAGAIMNAMPVIGSDPFMVLNGDSLCVMDYGAMVRDHVKSAASATIAVAQMPLNGDYGEVLVARDGRVEAFREKTVAGRNGAVNAGVYVFSRSAPARWPDRKPLSMEREVFPHMAESRELRAFSAHGGMLDIGTPERYALARTRLHEMTG